MEILDGGYMNKQKGRRRWKSSSVQGNMSSFVLRGSIQTFHLGRAILICMLGHHTALCPSAKLVRCMYVSAFRGLMLLQIKSFSATTELLSAARSPFHG